MDRDKDGIIGKGDIRATCDEVGRLTSDAEIDEVSINYWLFRVYSFLLLIDFQMLNDAPSPINFTMLINMFAQRQQGGASDDDDVVAKAFKAFAKDGLIDSEE